MDTDTADQLFLAALQICDDEARARQLLRDPLATFQGLSLLELAGSGRLQNALDYLASISSGFVG